MEVCEYFEKERRIEANTAAYTHAIGWTSLFNGFGGESSQKSSPWSLLPYPDEIRAAQKQNQARRVNEETEIVMRRLMKREELPVQVRAMLLSLIGD